MACNVPKEESPARPDDDEEENNRRPADDDKTVAKKKELERIEQEARETLHAKDWGGARQIIRSGLKMSKDQRGFEIQNARLLLLLGDVERETGNEMEARRHYTDAMAIFHVQKNDVGRFETLLSKCQLEARQGDYAAATREISQAEAFLPKLKDRRHVGRFKMVQGHLASRQVEPKEASEAYMEAIRIFEAAKDHEARAEVLLLLAAEEDRLGQLADSKRSIEKALAIFNEKENLDGKVRALHRLATYAEREHKWAKARKLYKDVFELYEQLDQRSDAANVSRHLNALPVQEKDKKKKK
jgi:tetratricopeptide (TPR) repeat protein